MRKHRWFILGFLLLPVVVLAQRPSGPDTSPKPSSSPPPPAPAPSPAPPRSEPSHAPAPSSPSSPAHTNSASSSSPLHTNSDWNRSAPPTHEPRPPKTEARTSARNGHDSPGATAREPKTAGPDLAPHPCKRPPCTTCPPGQSLAKNGKCISAPSVPGTLQAASKCLPGQTWNGATCVSATQTIQCPPDQQWNGTSCDPTECATFYSRAELIATEARSVKAQMLTPCAQDSSGQLCQDLTQRHDEIILRYRMLLNEAPSACRTTLPDPLSL